MAEPSSLLVSGPTPSHGNDPDPDHEYVARDKVRPSDVLCGRGNFSHSGNLRFLSLVADRKAEYAGSGTKGKRQIARDIVRLICEAEPECERRVNERQVEAGGEDGHGDVAMGDKSAKCKSAKCTDMPGRFLQEVPSSSDPSHRWRVISGPAVLEKVKMALRQKPRVRSKAKAAPKQVQVQAEAVLAPASGAAGKIGLIKDGSAANSNQTASTSTPAAQTVHVAADNSDGTCSGIETPLPYDVWDADGKTEKEQPDTSVLEALGGIFVNKETKALLEEDKESEFGSSSIATFDDPLPENNDNQIRLVNDEEEEALPQQMQRLDSSVTAEIGGLFESEALREETKKPSFGTDSTATFDDFLPENSDKTYLAQNDDEAEAQPQQQQLQQQEEEQEQMEMEMEIEPLDSSALEASVSVFANRKRQARSTEDELASFRISQTTSFDDFLQQIIENVENSDSLPKQKDEDQAKTALYGKNPSADNGLLEEAELNSQGKGSTETLKVWQEEGTGSSRTMPSSPNKLILPFLLGTVRLALDVVRDYRQQSQALSDGSSDLQTLGRVLYEHFAAPEASSSLLSLGLIQRLMADDDASTAHSAPGEDGDASSLGPTKRTKTDFVPLFGLGYPIRLSTLIDCLMDGGAAFASITDVEEELKDMLDYPDRYLLDTMNSVSNDGQLRFPENRLYGRDEQVGALMSAYDNVMQKGGKRGLVVISGYAGSGKTSLVEQIRPRLHIDGAMIISCKFDIQEQPMSSFFRAFDEYCHRLLAGEQDRLSDVRASISSALGSMASLLRGPMPCLNEILGVDLPVAEAETNDALPYTIRMFVRAISGPSHPVVVVFDDLHWANETCLGLIKLLVTDPELKSLLFVGCYREEEVPDDHPLRECLGEIIMDAESTKLPVSTICLDPLDKDSINSLLSDALSLSTRLTRPLADALHMKTGGNPMFVRQLMKSLTDERLLTYSASLRRWDWNIDAITEKSVPVNNVGLLINKMKAYEPGVQFALEVASCLGTTFQSATFGRVFSSTSTDAGESIAGACLGTVIADGIIIKVGQSLKFAHDLIWQAAYNLLELESQGEKELMHLQVGRQLLRNAGEERDKMLSTIVDQLNRGVRFVVDDSEKRQLAELNLHAGEAEIAASSFLAASIYLLQGSILIQQGDWDDNYDVCLRLFTLCAEAQLALGNIDDAIINVIPVLTHGRSPQDKVRAHLVYMKAKIAKSEQKEAIERGLVVLEQLGEFFPQRVDQTEIVNTLAKTQALLESTTVEEIVRQKATDDPTKIAVLSILMVCVRIGVATNPDLTLLFICRSVEVSMAGGLAAESSFAFSVGAFAFCWRDNHDLAAFCAQVAESLLRKFDRKYAQSVIPVLNLSIYAYRKPLQSCAEAFLDSCREAMAVGDVDWAIASLQWGTNISISAPQRGKTLEDVQNALARISEENGLYGAELFANYRVYLDEVLWNLRSTNSASTAPTVLFTHCPEEEEAMMAVMEKNQTYNRKVCSRRMWLAYLYRNYDFAAKMAAKIPEDCNFYYGIERIPETFSLGLIAFALIRKGRDVERWTRISTDAMDKLSKWAVNSEWNFQHKLELLKAEQAWTTSGDELRAADFYNAAIQTAGEHCFINEQALACERFAIFYGETGDLGNARKYFELAEGYYRDWGASRKAEDVLYLRQSYDVS